MSPKYILWKALVIALEKSFQLVSTVLPRVHVVKINYVESSSDCVSEVFSASSSRLLWLRVDFAL